MHMKLPDYARKLGIGYRTAWNMYKRGEIPGAYQLP
ncbi:MAG: IS607 family transposase, partial [Actinomycetia bacterium]|nr:IS607 family transposase [Actinomycetes bacterium]